MARKKKALPTWSAVAIPDVDKMSIEDFAEQLVGAFNALDELGYAPAERIAVPKKGMVIIGVKSTPSTVLEEKTSLGDILLEGAAEAVNNGFPISKAVEMVLSGKTFYEGREASIQDFSRAVKDINKFLRSYKKDNPGDTETLSMATALLKALADKIRLSVQ